MGGSRQIFDVGMNNGDDTAYYLFRGFSVVAVEADPALCEAAKERFVNEIEEDRLIICNVGIAEAEGQMEFWVSKHSEWSSFSRDNATKGRARAQSISIPTVRFGQLLRAYGVPYFLKVDIEGNDRLCFRELVDFKRPAFVSIEMSHEEGGADLELLESLGYHSFKCVRQNDFREISSANIRRQVSIRRAVSRVGVPGDLARRVMTKTIVADGWRFKRGSSGPMPEELSGEWIEYAEVRSIWEQLSQIDRDLGDKGLGEWFDFHARTEG
jgi:FkbM family methyltransferase